MEVKCDHCWWRHRRTPWFWRNKNDSVPKTTSLMKTTQWCHAGTKAILYYFVALNGSDLIVYRREGEEGGGRETAVWLHQDQTLRSSLSGPYLGHGSVLTKRLYLLSPCSCDHIMGEKRKKKKSTMKTDKNKPRKSSRQRGVFSSSCPGVCVNVDSLKFVLGLGSTVSCCFRVQSLIFYLFLRCYSRSSAFLNVPIIWHKKHNLRWHQVTSGGRSVRNN